MPKSPDHKRTFKEHQPLPYYLAATFTTREEAEQPYQRVQQMIYEPTNKAELSAFHFERRPHDPQQKPLARPWFVVVLGERPPQRLERQLREALASGEMTTLALETVVTLAQRREQHTPLGSWVEGHYPTGKITPEATITFRRKPKGKGRRRR